MNEIPDDIMEAAKGALNSAVSAAMGGDPQPSVFIASAILAERSRAASTARSWAHTCRKVGQSEGADVAEDIAKCIEEGK